MIYLFNALIVCILGLVIFLGLRAISAGLIAKSKLKRAKSTLRKKKKNSLIQSFRNYIVMDR